MSADCSSAIASFIFGLWGGDGIEAIRRRWPDASPEEVRRGIAIAAECWRYDSLEYRLERGRGADRGGA